VETRENWIVDGGVLLFGRLAVAKTSQTSSDEQRDSLHLVVGIETCPVDEVTEASGPEQLTRYLSYGQICKYSGHHYVSCHTRKVRQNDRLCIMIEQAKCVCQETPPHSP
jgi:hypothetical protein